MSVWDKRRSLMLIRTNLLLSAWPIVQLAMEVHSDRAIIIVCITCWCRCLHVNYDNALKMKLFWNLTSTHHSKLTSSHSGVGLFCQAVHADSLPYIISFLLFQTDTKKSPTLLYRELHSSFTNIPCFSPMLFVWECFNEVLCHFANVTLYMCVYRTFTTRGVGILLQVFSLAASWATVILAVQMKVNRLTFTFSVSAESVWRGVYRNLGIFRCWDIFITL